MSNLSLDDVHAWREAAIADGWSIEPTYPGHEPFEHAGRLKKDGWVAMLLARPEKESPYNPGRMIKAQVNISIWGPDTLAVDPVVPYDMAQLEANARKCFSCGATDVDTRRVAFCNRVCFECHPKERARLEKPGWCD